MSADAAGRQRSELSQRIIWGGIMAAIALAAVWLGDLPFAGMLAAGGALASWEWGRIVRGYDFDRYFLAHAAAVAVAVFETAAGYPQTAVTVLALVSILLFALRGGAGDPLSGLGVLVIGLAVVSLALLRADAPLGLRAVLFVFAVVWMTDIGGYVFGRSIGGPRLWPSISPGKTWAGAIGGLVFAAVTGAFLAGWLAKQDASSVVLVAVMLGLAAEYGDLAESALKRRFGRKDASALIPGHGGLLDRVDGLMAAAIVAALFAMLRDPAHPAAGLLLWP